MDLANNTVRKNNQERSAKRFGGAMDRWIWRFCLVLLIGATVGVVVQSLTGQTRILAGTAWSIQSATTLSVYVASLVVLAIEITGFYANDRLWIRRGWRNLRATVGFIGIVWFGTAVLWMVFVPPWLDVTMFGTLKMIDTVIVMVFAAIYGMFNWAGFSFKNTCAQK